MAYEPRQSKCKICNDEYLQVREAYVLCPKASCKAKNKSDNKKIYDKRRNDGIKTVKTYKALVLDTALPEVRMKNRFILGLT